MRLTLRNAALFAIGLLLICWPALDGDWVWDDAAWTTQISHLTKGSHGLITMWTSATALQQYFPVTGTSFWLDKHLWGTWTTPYHVENVLLHACSAALLGFMLSRLQVSGAWIAATLFAFHPVMIESIAWITERKNVLSLALSLGSIVCFGHYCRLWQHQEITRPPIWWVASFILGVAALLAKITAFVIIPALSLMIWWRVDTTNRRLGYLRSLIPLTLAAITFGGLTLWLEEHHVGADPNLFTHSPANHLLLASRIACFYAMKLILPVGLMAMYPKWDIQPTLWWQWLWPFLLVTGFVVCWKYRSRLARGSIVLTAIYFAALLPVSGILPVYGMTYSYVADRWCYTSSVPALVGVAWILSTRLSTITLRFTTAIVVLLFGFLGWQRAHDFTGLKDYWERALQKNPLSWLACQELGQLHQASGETDKALEYAKKAASLAPEVAQLHFNLATTLLLQQQHDEALLALLKAEELDPSLGGLYASFGQVWLHKNDLTLAKQYLEQELSRQPDHADALNNLGVIHLNQGRPDLALPLFQKLAAQTTAKAAVFTNIATAELALNHIPEALNAYERAMSLGNPSIELLNDYAWFLATIDESSGRDPAKALKLAQQAVQQVSKARPEVLRTLAAAQAALGDFTSATNTAKQALESAKKLNADLTAANIESDLRQFAQQKALYR
ncbi:MAG: tetratricopeptide repeat protein [Verrucomicrobiaceae bacterium]|nr:tetratricopeptide repeat protein [Verrucomicrobiaceae bacterium]